MDIKKQLLHPSVALVLKGNCAITSPTLQNKNETSIVIFFFFSPSLLVATISLYAKILPKDTDRAVFAAKCLGGDACGSTAAISVGSKAILQQRTIIFYGDLYKVHFLLQNK